MKRKITLILLIALILTSCAPQQQSSGTTIDVGEAIDLVEENKTKELEEKALTEAERIAWDYADGVYLNDYTEIKEKLNEEAYSYIESYLVDNYEPLDYFEVKIDLYNKYYSEVELNALTFADIINNNVSWIKRIDVRAFQFIDETDSIDSFVTERNRLIEPFWGKIQDYLGIESTAFRYRIGYYDKKYYDDFQEYDMNNMTYDEVVFAMKDKGFEDDLYGLNSSRANYSNKNTDEYYGRAIKRLQQRYNEEFIYVQTFDLVGGSMFIPRSNKDLCFEGNSIEDRYINVRVEQYLNNEISKILKQMGVEDKFGLFVASKGGEEKFSDYKADVKYLHSKIKNHVTLYYFSDEDGVYDYKLLREVLNKVQDIVFVDSSGNRMFVKEVQASKNDQATFIKILNDNPITENYIRNDKLFESWEMSSNDSDAFLFLHQYCEFGGNMYEFLSPASKELTDEEYLNEIKVK